MVSFWLIGMLFTFGIGFGGKGDIEAFEAASFWEQTGLVIFIIFAWPAALGLFLSHALGK